MKKIGLALGAGGARGLAHIVLIEALEELEIQPTIIAGSSIGAIVGAFYAAGFKTDEMKHILHQIIHGTKSKFWEIHKKSDFIKYFDLLDPTIKIGGLLKGDKLANFLSTQLKINDFNKLQIPLKVVATDYFSKNQVVLDKGELVSAVRASYALPFLFSPVKREKKILVDGGMVNPLPYDILFNDCDLTIAVDVSASNGARNKIDIPPAYEVFFSAFQIMQGSIINEKTKNVAPDIHIRTNIEDVRVHEFMKADTILENARPYKIELKKKLTKLLSL